VFVSVVITGSMMVVSSMMLKLPWTQVIFYLAAIATMSTALCGLAVALGALFPNFKEENPSKIVSGFGGTLCLVISFIYLILFLSLTAIPGLSRVSKWPMAVPDWLSLGLAALLSFGVLYFPLQLAWRRVKRLEI
jgi:ABC-2 type transport system permease protein